MKTDLQRHMNKTDLDCILIVGASSYNPMMTYFAPGAFFTRAMIVIKRGEQPVLIYRPMERDTAEQTGLKRISFDKFPMKTYLAESNGDQALAGALELKAVLNAVGLSKGKIALCGKVEIGNHLPVIQAFMKIAPEYEIAGSEGIDCLENCRYTKDDQELESIRKMGKATEQIAGQVVDFIRSCTLINNQLQAPSGEKVTIGDLKTKIDRWLGAAGGENPQGTILSMGRDAAVPHNNGDDQAILEGGKTIVFDFFPCEAGGGYFHDFTRTWCIGYADDAIQKAYDQVKEVHHEIVRSITPGIAVKTLQQKTCTLFKEMGHKTVAEDNTTTEGYVHSVSHGLGLNIHERPFSGMGALDTDLVEPGVAFTVEPGLYYPDIENPYGIRIEDTFYIDEEGKTKKFIEFPYELVIPVKSDTKKGS